MPEEVRQTYYLVTRVGKKEINLEIIERGDEEWGLEGDITVVPLHLVREELNRHEQLGKEYVFAIVDIVHGMVERFLESYTSAKEEILEEEPTRWYNPVLIIVPKGLMVRFLPRGEGDMADLIPIGFEVGDVVVGLPRKRRLYHSIYDDDVEDNLKRFNLDGR